MARMKSKCARRATSANAASGDCATATARLSLAARAWFSASMGSADCANAAKAIKFADDRATHCMTSLLAVHTGKPAITRAAWTAVWLLKLSSGQRNRLKVLRNDHPRFRGGDLHFGHKFLDPFRRFLFRHRPVRVPMRRKDHGGISKSAEEPVSIVEVFFARASCADQSDIRSQTFHFALDEIHRPHDQHAMPAIRSRYARLPPSTNADSWSGAFSPRGAEPAHGLLK